VQDQGFSKVILHYGDAGAYQRESSEWVRQEMTDGPGYIAKPGSAHETQAEIAQGGKVLGCMAGTNAAGVFTKADVTNVM
jgi:hypothetical protein